MKLSYKELLEAQLKYGTTKEDILKESGFKNILPNVVIAPWWEVNIFNNYGFKINKINEKIYNLSKDNIEFSFIQVKQVGAPAIIEEVLSLGTSKCKNLVFIGSAGSLSKEINIGDIILPKSSICGDGASRYLNKDLDDDFSKKEFPNKELIERLLESATNVKHNLDIKVFNATNFSVDTVFAQFPHIDKIVNMGAETIEMETYSFFKACNVVGIKSSAILCISDNTIVKKSLYSGRTEEENILRKKVRSEIVPKIIINLFKKNN